MDNIKNEIIKISLLANNWDGYGGVKVSQSICEKTTNFISILSSSFTDKIYDIFPNPNGTISIEWVNSKNEKLHLEIGEENYSYFIRYNDKNPYLFDGNNIIQDYKNITLKLEKLFK